MIEEDSIVIKFNIFEGEKILVERINILGNSITNEAVIRGEMEIDEGDPFTNLSQSMSSHAVNKAHLQLNAQMNILGGQSKRAMSNERNSRTMQSKVLNQVKSSKENLNT